MAGGTKSRAADLASEAARLRRSLGESSPDPFSSFTESGREVPVNSFQIGPREVNTKVHMMVSPSSTAASDKKAELDVTLLMEPPKETLVEVPV